MAIKFRFNIDRDCNLPHCYVRHLVTEGEAIEARYAGRLQEQVLKSGAYSRQAVVESGKEVVVIWVWRVPDQVVFIITAYENGKGAYHEG